MGFDVLVGIPSRNEADTIGHVLSQIDTGLSQYFPQLRSLIVNFDNDSDDGTRDAFMAVPTQVETRYISTQPGVSGKGRNVQNFLGLARDLGVAAGAIVDADLKSVSPRWVRNLLAPILYENFDLTFPIYRRHRYDGSVTALLCFPAVYGLFATNIRQPIGGEFGFSRSYISHLSEYDLPESTRGYGIDLFLTTEAIGSRSRLCGAALGTKRHRDRERVTLGDMVQDMMATLLHQVSRHRELLRQPALVCSPPAIDDIHLSDTLEESPLPAIQSDEPSLAALFADAFGQHETVYAAILPADVQTALHAMIRDGQPAIGSETWCRIVYAMIGHFLSAEQAHAAGIARALVPLFFARLVSMAEETRWLTDQLFESYIVAQAQVFFDQRMAALDQPDSAR